MVLLHSPMVIPSLASYLPACHFASTFLGCVNTLAWNNDGTELLSGSDDHCVCIWSTKTRALKARVRTKHENNIFSARYAPNDASRVRSFFLIEEIGETGGQSFVVGGEESEVLTFAWDLTIYAAFGSSPHHSSSLVCIKRVLSFLFSLQFISLSLSFFPFPFSPFPSLPSLLSILLSPM